MLRTDFQKYSLQVDTATHLIFYVETFKANARQGCQSSLLANISPDLLTAIKTSLVRQFPENLAQYAEISYDAIPEDVFVKFLLLKMSTVNETDKEDMTTEFQNRDPLLEVFQGQDEVWPDLRIWWIFSVLQFVAVETFFRGFLVLGLAKRFGQMSILIATIPYLMIHFTKPPVEALAAIVGGIVMGFLAYRTKSVWWGVALHVSVAALMDFLSLGQKGFIW